MDSIQREEMPFQLKQLLPTKTISMENCISGSKAMKEGMKVIEPLLKSSARGNQRNRIVMGTVRGDLHDIGKNLFCALLEGAGFEVIDLGVDVAPEKFIDSLRTHDAKILGMSALITTTMSEMANTITKVKDAGIRSSTKIILGGAPVTEDYGKSIEADAATNDAIRGIDICKVWTKKQDGSITG
jgi:5-methyltetrahydrofolate--homocysteine methyltransferase